MKKIVKTDLCPKAIGPYSQAIMVGDFLFASGQVGINPIDGNIVEGGIQAQAEQVIKNIKGLLESCGLSMDNIVKSTIFITDMNNFSLINEIYGKYFPDSPPARSCVEVKRLPKEALVEIEVIAHK